VKNPEIGQYVIVHAGYAIEVMDEEQAREALNIFEEIIEKDMLD
jgi:hydrogenase expression/formation protein HypC